MREPFGYYCGVLTAVGTANGELSVCHESDRMEHHESQSTDFHRAQCSAFNFEAQCHRIVAEIQVALPFEIHLIAGVSCRYPDASRRFLDGTIPLRGQNFAPIAIAN